MLHNSLILISYIYELGWLQLSVISDAVKVYYVKLLKIEVEDSK